jgi:hypothetical protein
MPEDYCRFRTTVRELADCLAHLLDPLSNEEHAARLELVNVCATILEECGVKPINRADIQIEQREENLPRTRPPGQS